MKKVGFDEVVSDKTHLHTNKSIQYTKVGSTCFLYILPMQKESKPQPTNLSDKIRCSDPHFYLHFQGTKGYETEQKQTKQ